MPSTPTDNVAPLREGDSVGTRLRTPPVNYEAEQALLGAILANNLAFEKVSEFLRAEHFADPLHGRIFEAVGRLIERGQIANSVTLKHYFESDGALEEIGGTQYLARLQNAVIPIINAADYGRTIHDLYLRRQLVDLGEEVVNDAFDGDLDLDAVDQIEKAEHRLYQLAEAGQTESGFLPFHAALSQAIEMAEAAHKREGELAGMPTGFVDLDKLMGGLHNSDLVIVAGRPSMGKTAFATNLAFNAVRFAGAVAGFFSLEMSSEQLATRMLSEQARVPSEKIRRGELSNDEFDRIIQASRALEALPFFIDDTPAISVAQLRARARRLKRQHGVTLLLVDYLQLMRPSPGQRPENRVQEISEITRGLKAVAKELNLPVVAISQLSRAVEQREDKRPQLSDLRESGSIEQDADVVMFVFREEYYLQKAEPIRRPEESEDKFHERYTRWQERCDQVYGTAEVIVSKQRHGPTGKVRLTFDGPTTSFSNHIDRDHIPDPDVPF
jgi:replicative DNA helicase